MSCSSYRNANDAMRMANQAAAAMMPADAAPVPGLGDIAPDFTAMTTQGMKSLSGYRGKWLIFFSHPGDFTPVCTTEFLAFTQRYQDFTDRNADLLGLSVDSNASHIAWVINIYRTTGVEIPFPIVADRDMRISRMYGMIQPGVETTETVRNVFFIDPEGVIRAKLIYPLTNGRNIAEILRLLEALQTTDAQKVATPANWRPGFPTIQPAPTTVSGAMERLSSGGNCMDWYLCYNSETRSS
jgi:peroxiredoxin 2/4